MTPILAKALEATGQSLPVGKLTALAEALTVEMTERFPQLAKARPKYPPVDDGPHYRALPLREVEP